MTRTSRSAFGWPGSRTGARRCTALPALAHLGDRRLDESRATRSRVRRRPDVACPSGIIELADDAIPLLIETFRKTKRDSRDVPRIVHGEMEPRDWEMARGAALAFPAFARAVPPLLKALDATDAETRQYAGLALRKVAEVNGLPESAIERLEKALDGLRQGGSAACTRAVAQVRPANARATTILLATRKDLDSLARTCSPIWNA